MCALEYFQRISLPNLSIAKLKAGIVNGSELRKLTNNEDFWADLSNSMSEAWNSFKFVVHHFLGNKKSSSQQHIVQRLLKNYLKCHLDFFDERCLGMVSDEQGRNCFCSRAFLRSLGVSDYSSHNKQKVQAKLIKAIRTDPKCRYI